MTAWIALLRAVNLGGASRLPMADLKRICEEAGFAKVSTYIASGNVVFESTLKEGSVRARLEKALEAYGGKRIDVLIRDAAAFRGVADEFPFRGIAGNRGVVIFLNKKPPSDALEQVAGVDDEQVALGKREIYVAYGRNGIGRSKLRIPAAKYGTARNMNVVTKLADMAEAL